MEVSGQLHAPATLAPSERALGIHWIGGWVGPRAGQDAVEKQKSCTAGNRNRNVQPITIPTELSRFLCVDIGYSKCYVHLSVRQTLLHGI
jgi:hypothetical protein